MAFFMVLLSLSRLMLGCFLEIGQSRFLLYAFQVLILLPFDVI